MQFELTQKKGPLFPERLCSIYPHQIGRSRKATFFPEC
jgi:hypothetical protein